MRRLAFIIAGVAVFALVLVFFMFIASSGKHTAPDQKAVSEEALFKDAQSKQEAGELLKAREIYQGLIKNYPQGKYVSESEQAIWALNIKIIFSPIQTPDSKIYEIQPGDTLGKIAKSFGTTVDLLMKANNLKSDLIRPGMKLRVETAKFSILVDKSQNTLILKADDEIFKIYPVATGLNNSTPIGVFKIAVKIINPTWYKAGAVVPPGSSKNILGTRWLGLSLQGYGIHGTTDPDSIGKQATAGCVRMLNNDVEELYIIVPAGTEVTVVD